MFGQRRQSLLVNGLQSLSFSAERRVKSARRLCNRLQPRFVQMRLHELACVVLYKTASLFGRNRDQVAVGCADTDGVNFQAVFRRCFGGSEFAAGEVLAVGQQDEDFVAARAVLERSLRFANRAADIRAAAGDDGRVERGQ